VGNQTKIKIDIGGEIFRARGLIIVENNWLEIYSPYEKWVDTVVPDFKPGDTFEPTLIEI
jgi:DNA topoisomerase-3